MTYITTLLIVSLIVGFVIAGLKIQIVAQVTDLLRVCCYYEREWN